MPTSVLRRTVAQLFMVGIPGPTIDDGTKAFLAERPPGGVILFKRNVKTARQVRSLVDALHAIGSGVRAIVSIDHEGGRVHRLPRPFTHFPPAAQWTDPRTAEAVGLAMGRELSAVGIDLDFAPVLDVWSNPENRVIGDRAFGTTPAPVVRAALAQARGLGRGGVLTCGKHFPGHGDTLADSHVELPRVAKSRRALEAMELAPFRRAIAARIPALMTAHVVYPALDPRRPATLSPLICRNLLRRRLGFQGLLFSDDLEMQAVAGRADPGKIAVGALQAGCDMLLVCQSLAVAAKAMDGVEQAVARGRLSADAVATALGRIQAFRCQQPPTRRTPSRLGWPAHARLARRIARDAART